MMTLMRSGTKAVLSILLLFSLFIEVVIIPIILGEIGSAFPEVDHLIVPAFIGIALVMLCGQAMIAITWMLTSLSQDERIFSPRALRLVTVLTALPFAIVALLVIAFTVLSVLDVTQPGVTFAIIGSAIVALAVGFILITMRSLLMRSIALHTEMSEVV